MWSTSDLDDDSRSRAQVMDDAKSDVAGRVRAGCREFAQVDHERRRRDVIRELEADAEPSAPERDPKVGADAEVEREDGLGFQFVDRDEELTAAVNDNDRVGTRTRTTGAAVDEGQRRSNRPFQVVGDAAEADESVRPDGSRRRVIDPSDRPPDIVKPGLDAN